MTAKALLTKYSALPAPERRKVKAYFAQVVTKEENARDLAAARRALAEQGTDTDWQGFRATLPWKRKVAR